LAVNADDAHPLLRVNDSNGDASFGTGTNKSGGHEDSVDRLRRE